MYEQYSAHHSAVSVKVSLMSSPENIADPPCLKHLMCRPSVGVDVNKSDSSFHITNRAFLSQNEYVCRCNYFVRRPVDFLDLMFKAGHQTQQSVDIRRYIYQSSGWAERFFKKISWTALQSVPTFVVYGSK